LGPHLALLTHGGSAAALKLNLASNSQAGLLLLVLAMFPLQLFMGGITAVRLLIHLPRHLLLLDLLSLVLGRVMYLILL
jgi:hypothetical protein